MPLPIDPTALFLPALIAGRSDDVLALFAGEPRIDDPRHGHVAGADAVRTYVERQAGWIEEHDLAQVPIRTTLGDGRSVSKSLAMLTVDGEPTELPIAVVGDHAPDADGDRLSAIRVYHSTWPLEGSHQLRPPLVPEDPDLHLPDVVAEYMAALGSANLEGSLAVFEPDGYFREPSGGPHLYSGPDGIRAAYGAFYAVGPIHLLHCTVIDDGVACGVEFIAVGWGPRKFTPQAGVGVYERGPTGRLKGARVYDDVDVDLGLQPG